MCLNILGIGVATPPHRLTNELAVDIAKRCSHGDARQERLKEILYRQSGIRERRTCVPPEEAYQWLPGGKKYQAQSAAGDCYGPPTSQRAEWYREHAPALAEEAARSALQDAGVSAKEVTHVVTVSCTGFDAPGVDLHLIETLNLRSTTQRVNVGFMGCHGAINGLRVANGLASQPNATILLVAVELCSLHYSFTSDSERVLANALFADGAGALVGVSDGRSTLEGPMDSWRVAATGSMVMPSTADIMSWRLGDHGFEMSLSSKLPALIETHLGDWLQGWLAEQGAPANTISSWAIHPGGPRILEAVEATMSLDREQTEASRSILANRGNMSSATLLFIIQRLRQQQAPLPCVMVGFGPGIVAEVALLA